MASAQADRGSMLHCAKRNIYSQGGESKDSCLIRLAIVHSPLSERRLCLDRLFNEPPLGCRRVSPSTRRHCARMCARRFALRGVQQADILTGCVDRPVRGT